MPYWTEKNGHKVFGSVKLQDEWKSRRMPVFCVLAFRLTGYALAEQD
jgi:hypothetical protein